MRKLFCCICFVLIVFLFASCSDKVIREIVAQKTDNPENGARMVQGYNYLSIPNGKTLYTLVINPSVSSGARLSLRGYDFKGASKSLIPVNRSDELQVKTTRTDVYLPLNDGSPVGVSPSKGTVSYLGENAVNSILYFIEENALKESSSALEFVSKDGDFRSVYVDYKNQILPRLNVFFSTNMLDKERKYFGLSEYDVDQTGFFHVVFSDFGTDSAVYSGKLGASGTTGMYNTKHIRTIGSTNKADMFFVNTRYVNVVIKKYVEYLESNYTSEEISQLSGALKDPRSYFYSKVVNDIKSTLLHEYMHYLMDANIYLKYGEDFDASLLSPGSSIFWIEGMAEAASYLLGGSDENGHQGFVSEWLRNGISLYPKTGEELDSCMKYAVAPMFFLFIKEEYGISTLRKFAQYSKLTEVKNGYEGKSLDVIVKDCTGRSFDELYREFILRLFAPVAGVSKFGSELSFAGDWSITKDVIEDNCISVKSYVEGEDSKISKGGAFLLRWENNPETLYVDSDCEVYAFYI